MVFDATALAETKGFVGERYDEDASLQYDNARYYDAKLALFIQPAWFEVTKGGVGTNRYSHSFNDPVNKFDPGGNFVQFAAIAACAAEACEAFAAGVVATTYGLFATKKPSRFLIRIKKASRSIRGQRITQLSQKLTRQPLSPILRV